MILWLQVMLSTVVAHRLVVQLRHQIAPLNPCQRGGTIITHQAADENPRRVRKLRGRITALHKAERILDGFVIQAASVLEILSISRRRRAPASLYTAARGVAAHFHPRGEERSEHRHQQQHPNPPSPEQLPGNRHRVTEITEKRLWPRASTSVRSVSLWQNKFELKNYE